MGCGGDRHKPRSRRSITPVACRQSDYQRPQFIASAGLGKQPGARAPRNGRKPRLSDSMSRDYVKGASAAIKNRTKDLVEAFDLDVDLSGSPTEGFARAIAGLDDHHRNVLEEVARRAFRLGARRGATAALDAVIDGEITVDDTESGVVFRMEKKSLPVPVRRLTIASVHRGDDLHVKIEPFSIKREKLGFE